MKPSVYLGRLPIYDAQRDIYGYELLYRNTNANSAVVNDNLHATARVFVNALNYVGLNNLTRKKLAFIKVDDKTLFDDIIYAISPAHFILELLEESNVTAELIERMGQLHKKGYRFALNHYRENGPLPMRSKAFLSLIDYVKIDLSHHYDLPSLLSRLAPYGLQFIAEKIEDEASFQKAKTAGFHYFQGYYFSNVNLFKKDKIDPQNSLLISLIYLLKSDASMEELIAKVDESPYLTLNLLKFIQLHEGMGHQSIASLEQAMVLIGRERLGNWLELMLYAYDEEGAQESNFAKQLRQQAIQRAYLMEELARHTKSSEKYAHAAYMTGLLSVSEALFSDRLSDLLKQIHIEASITNALLKRKGELGQLLELTLAVEKNDLDAINEILGHLVLTQLELNECVMLSYRRSSSAPE